MADNTKVKLTLTDDDGKIVRGMSVPPLGSAATRQHDVFLQRKNALSDLPDIPAARANLGLGSAAVKNVKPGGGVGPGAPNEAVQFQNLGTAAFKNVDDFTFVARPDTPPDYHTPVSYVGGAIVRVRNAGDRVRFADNVRIENGCLHVNYNPPSESQLRSATDKGIITAWMNGALRFRVDHGGATYASGPYSGSGADYAERFQSLSGERIAPGTTVVLEKGAARASTVDDDPNSIFGVIRPEGAAGMVGNDAELNWACKYRTDAFGAPLTVTRSAWRWFDEEYDATRTVPAEGSSKPETIPKEAVLIEISEPVLNPEFDSTRPYVPRSQRSEWVVVGLLGQIPIANGQAVRPSWIRMAQGPVASLWLVR